MQTLSKKQFFIIAFMLFSMFFGVGNFIFPPVVGRESGENFYIAIMFFCLTAVTLPVLVVGAVAQAGGLVELTRRVDVGFSLVFMTLNYLAIGPMLGIPRAGNMPFEISIVPFLGEGSHALEQALYSAAYFGLNYYMCLKPSRLTTALGKYLTPALLSLIILLFVVGFFVLPTNFSAPSGGYVNSPASTAFIAGYQTMDALAALAFGVLVTKALKSNGISGHGLMVATIKAGIFAGAVLASIYFMLGYMGAITASSISQNSQNAQFLSDISNLVFGSGGRVVLGGISFLACLTTTTGLIGAVSAYFESILPRISYKKWVLIWTILSFGVANIGLNEILKISIPILIALYPIAIVLILLSLINSFIDGSKLVYKSCVYLTAAIGVVNALDHAGIKLGFITTTVQSLPFYSQMLGWVVPAALCFVITYMLHYILAKNTQI